MASTPELVNKALQFFQLKQRLTIKDIPDESEFLNPFVTVARDPGSGGAPIAQAVAEKLGYEFVDEQIVEDIARSTKRRRAIIREIDEKGRSQIDDMVHSLLNAEYVDDETYVKELIKLILSYAHKGHCVILGRGANFITPFGRGLHVSVTAPYEVRVQRAMDYEGHTQKKAKQVIAKIEKERHEFVQQYFKRSIKNRNVFDLTLNTSHYTVPKARDVIIEAFKQKFSL